jgi:hypothetical protein
VVPEGINRERRSEGGFEGICRGVIVSYDFNELKSARCFIETESSERAHILLVRQEIHVVIEMLISKSSFLDELVLKFTFRFHHQQEHVVVRSAGEEDPVGDKKRRGSDSKRRDKLRERLAYFPV